MRRFFPPGGTLLGAATVSLFFLVPLSPAQPRRNRANYKLARKFSKAFLKQFFYSTSVRPHWIGKTSRFWYSYKTSKGTTWWLVDPEEGKKVPLFDHFHLAALLTQEGKKAVDQGKLPLSGGKIDDKGKLFTFNALGFRFEYDLKKGTLKKLGKAVVRKPSLNWKGLTDRERRERIRKFLMERQRLLQERKKKKEEKGGRPASRPSRRARSYAPDKSAYIFVKDYDLYYVPGIPIPPAASRKAGKGAASRPAGKKAAKAASRPAGKGPASRKKARPKGPRFKYDEKKAVRLTKDGAEGYTFMGLGGRGSRFGRGVKWSEDSKAFYIFRRDVRGVKELYLVNSIARPRPTLEKYRYPMPGEEKIGTRELYYFNKAAMKLVRVAPKWKDESYLGVHWLKGTEELRFIRRDRPRRSIEFCAVDTRTGKARVLFSESVTDGYMPVMDVKYLEKRKQMIWWSQRTGWGHFYLYDLQGKLLGPITSGPFRASRIVKVDEDGGWLYFRGNGREKGENVYYEHLYKVRLDGTGLRLLDPGNATHSSVVSPDFKFVVDNASRVDEAPYSVLRDNGGRLVMRLEKTDLAPLFAVGWKLPETFQVKAADGVTDLYGNMWKPFDFDPKKKYPIIVNVYPGPQMEGVTRTFSFFSGRQELANLGFIVIQVGHRGGSPRRSRAYANFGYYNLRDYALPDTKSAIEQLALRHPWIDIDKVGIYGHSGGGFMTAAALLVKPYNEFFKVGVASSGNHDNNIYNSSWSERYHGLKVVTVEKKTGEKGKSGAGKGGAASRRTRGRFFRGRRGGRRGAQRGGKGRLLQNGPDRKGRGDAEKKEKKKEEKKSAASKKAVKKETRFEIHVPTNIEVAANLKGHLLLVHGEIDNNVHPANTMRLVDALIKANKRFDMLIIPGARHSYGRAREYFKQRLWEYFAQYLLGDHQPGADIMEKSPYQER